MLYICGRYATAGVGYWDRTSALLTQSYSEYIVYARATSGGWMVVYERGQEECFTCLYAGKGEVTFVCGFGALFIPWYIVYSGHKSSGVQV